MSDRRMAVNLSPHPFTEPEVASNSNGKSLLGLLSSSRTGWAPRAWSAPAPAERNGPSRGLALAALGLLWVYRVALSPLLHALFGPACRFEPSCSRFAADAIRDHGVGRGTAMTFKRLARCHPLGGHGYDPVPAAGHSRKK
jgi:putative membrane protein insertion efficiency factor